MAGLLGDVEHHQPAMTASLLKRFCRTSRTLPDRDDQRDGKLSVDTARRPGEEGHRHEGSVAKIVKLEHAWRRLDGRNRSEEHTSELQSLMRSSYAVFCLIKKNTKDTSL